MREFQETKCGVIKLFLMILLFVVGTNVVSAQVTASMSGTVQDPAGAAVPGAHVTVTSLETGAARTLTTDEAGKYQVLSLPVGRYEVKAEQAGFKAEVQTGINLVVGQQAVVNLRLEVGAVREQVTVTSDAPLINTTTSSISGLVGEQQVKELPLNGRSFDLLILLNPGTSNITSTRGTQGGNLYMGGNWFSVAGRRPVENLTLMNGVEYSGAGTITAGPAGASQQLLGVDAIREYNVLSDTYGVEYGQRAGAQISVVTQSGTNQLHGTLFEFLRNSKLDARNFFDFGTIPAFKRNQFGGALGGPIRKDKTFLFGNYEGFRQRLGISNVSFVPDANARIGLLPCGSGGVTCAAGTAVGTPTKVSNLDNRILPYLNNYWPAPNGSNLGGGIAQSFNNPKESVREDFGTLRFDQRFSDKNSLSGAYTITDGFSLDPGPDPLFGFGITMRNQVVSLQDTHIFSPQVVNTVTAGYSRANYGSTSTTLSTTIPAGLEFVTGLPPGAITIGNLNTSSGWTQPGFGNPFSHFVRNLFTYMDGLQVIKGKHQISAGVSFKRIQNNDNDPLRGDGQVSFGTITSFMQGIVGTFTVAPVTISNGWRTWQGAWYLQDSIQLRPNLTVRLGLRHEFSNGFSEATGRAQTELFVNGVIQTLPRVSSSLLTENNSKWLLSPRIALAWDPFGKGMTSIRAGFGTYYDLADWLVYFVDVTPPLNGAATYSNVSLFSIIPINTKTPLAPPCGAGVPNPCTTYLPKSVESNYKIPTVESWNFSVEQKLARATALRVAYLGSHNYHQWVTIDQNTIPPQICSNPAGCISGGLNSARGLVPPGTEYVPVTPTRPNPYLGSGMFAKTHGYGNYNSLQVEVTQRLTSGLQFRASYAWSKNMDISSALTGAAAHPLNPSQDYGLSALSVSRKATGNLSYELPFGQGKALFNGMHGVADKLIGGWQLNSIATLQTGYPLTVTTGGNQSGNGDSNGSDRPSWNPAFTGKLITGTPNQWYNPNAFALPVPGTFGSVGRGVFTGPGLVSLDFSLLKIIKFSERTRLQFRAEVFNSLNRANFSRPSTAVFSGSAISPVAGVISSTETTSRQIQFGLKLVF